MWYVRLKLFSEGGIKRDGNSQEVYMGIRESKTGIAATLYPKPLLNPIFGCNRGVNGAVAFSSKKHVRVTECENSINTSQTNTVMCKMNISRAL